MALVLEAASAMYLEETGTDPARETPASFRHMIGRQIEKQRTWIWRQGHGLLFKVDVSNAYAGGAMIAGVYTAPAVRRQGVARRALCTLLHRLAGAYPQVVLYVNGENHAAIRLYETLGFVYHCPYRTIHVT